MRKIYIFLRSLYGKTKTHNSYHNNDEEKNWERPTLSEFMFLNYVIECDIGEKKKKTNQWNKTESPEFDPHKNSQLFFDKEAKNNSVDKD